MHPLHWFISLNVACGTIRNVVPVILTYWSDIRACFNAYIHCLVLFNVSCGSITNVVSATPTRTDMRLQECVSSLKLVF